MDEGDMRADRLGRDAGREGSVATTKEVSGEDQRDTTIKPTAKGRRKARRTMNAASESWPRGGSMFAGARDLWKCGDAPIGTILVMVMSQSKAEIETDRLHAHR